MNIGKIVKTIEWSENNYRNSEGSFIQIGQRIYFAYSRYRRAINNDDHDPSDIALIVSDDNGETFSAEKIILTPEECGGTNIMSTSLLKMQDGSVGLFYLKKEESLQGRMFFRRTVDFKQFSEETQVIFGDGYFVVNNDRVRRLSDGSIIVPAACHHVSLVNDKYSPTRRATAQFFLSEDDGKTFKKISSCEMPYKIFGTGLQEPGVIELKDGALLAYFRNDSGRQFIAHSTDKGKSWTTPEPSRFTSPISPMSMQRIDGNKIISVYNPAPLYYGRVERANGEWTGARNPLICEYSDDEAESFKNITVFEDDENSGFCYVAIFELIDSVLFAYCAGGAMYKCPTLNRIAIRKVMKSEIFN
jgi:hypothetical protein